MRPDSQHLRGLALTCAVLTLLGVLALTRDEGGTAASSTGRGGELVAAGADDGETAQLGPAPTAPPLFPASTSSTRPGKTTSTSVTTTRPATVAALKPPALGTYRYTVSGTETSGTAGKRALPATMTVTAQRPSGRSADDVVFDLRFSEQHTEQEIVTFRADAIALRQQSRKVDFGFGARTGAAVYGPLVVVAALPLAAGATRSGTSEVRDLAGKLVRVEDWKVTDVALRGDAWEIAFERSSRPGAAETVRETRRGWFDPSRSIWVKWEEHVHSERPNELGATYSLDYVANLT